MYVILGSGFSGVLRARSLPVEMQEGVLLSETYESAYKEGV